MAASPFLLDAPMSRGRVGAGVGRHSGVARGAASPDVKDLEVGDPKVEGPEIRDPEEVGEIGELGKIEAVGGERSVSKKKAQTVCHC